MENQTLNTVVKTIGIAGSFSEWGQPFCPAKIQSFPAKIQSFPANIFSCQGGPSLPILFCHAKLLCQTVLPMGKHCRWMAAKQSKISEKTGKYGRNQPKVAENRQKWQKTLENVEFCKLSSAKLSFLSCQAPISVLPSCHFCPAKLPFLSCQAN